VTDLRAWAKRLNDTSLRQIAALREPSRPAGWPLAGMFAMGLLVGAIGSYSITQRAQIKRLVTRALMSADEGSGEPEGVSDTKSVTVTSHRSNHRRKAAAEVR
jgi:hypothetical protein